MVPGRLSEDDISEIVDGCLIDSEYFVPALVGLGDDGIDGGAWFELDRGSFTPTSEPLRASLKVSRPGLCWVRFASSATASAGSGARPSAARGRGRPR